MRTPFIYLQYDVFLGLTIEHQKTMSGDVFLRCAVVIDSKEELVLTNASMTEGDPVTDTKQSMLTQLFPC